ncbi:hypothetical protein HYE82_07415 [Streptomyces sp. BR123]|uniref:hypothetical protein n=1 Tax=Streptomyces sp. BR123 TaxID=2749828 RepID=UPI0015C4CA87|nr:hypothetical protein [Streptomyces sp. BR123]NXY94217.1 hypothetical protein [Streptomyces sp. BR123]
MPEVPLTPFGLTLSVTRLPPSNSHSADVRGGVVIVIAMLVPAMLLLMLVGLPALEDRLFPPLQLPPAEQATPEQSAPD